MEAADLSRRAFAGQSARVVTERRRKDGSLVHVEGSLRTHEWTDKAGAKRYTTEVVARQVQLLEKRERPEEEPQKTEEPPFERPEVDEDIPF